MFSQIMAASSWKTLYNQHISFSQSFGIHLKQIWSPWRLMQQFSETSEQTHIPTLCKYLNDRHVNNIHCENLKDENNVFFAYNTFCYSCRNALKQ